MLKSIVSGIVVVIFTLSAQLSHAQEGPKVAPQIQPRIPSISEPLVNEVALDPNVAKPIPGAISTPGSGAVCKVSCAGAVNTVKFLDRVGNCNQAVNSPCFPYACGTKTCKDACATNLDCAAGTVCDPSSRQCLLPSYRCSDDSLSVVSANGTSVSCSPSRCRGGQCITFCASTLDCQGGFVCNFSSRTCVAPPTGDYD